MSTVTTREDDVRRISEAIEEASDVVRRLTSSTVGVRRKGPRNDPVTEVDLAVDAVLRKILPGPDEGWLSEETADNGDRLNRRRVWVVDPLDGTREFIDGVPEWCISVGLVEDGRPVAGGIAVPATGERFVGSIETGLRLQGAPARVTGRGSLEGSSVLASRSEMGKGLWEPLRDKGFEIVPMGSVALKLAQVAAGRHDATWSLQPKHEWDVAGGAALVLAAGGEVRMTDGAPVIFNQPRPWLPGILACTPSLLEPSLRLLRGR